MESTSSSKRESRAARMVLAHTLVKWENVKHIDDVDAAFMGDIGYWDDEELIKEVGSNNPVDIELYILRGTHQHQWGSAQPYGKPMWEHLCCFMKVLTPEKTHILPELYNLAQAACIIAETGGKSVSLIGAQSTSKTGGVTRIMNALSIIHLGKTMAFVGCPNDNVSDTGAWGELKELAEISRENHPHLFKSFKAYKERTLNYDSDSGKFGMAMARTPSDARKYKGTKQHASGEGFIILFNEEINEHQRNAYATIEKNVASNRNLLVLNAFNWESNDDLGAMVTTPDESRGKFKEHGDIDIDGDIVWDSIGEGIVIRNDGAKSAQILAGKNLVPYNYFGQENWEFLMNRFGDGTPEFLSQARAYPSAESEVDKVLSRTALLNSRYKDAYSIVKEVGRTAHLDAAFGGKDKSIYSWAVTYDVYYMDGDDNRRKERIIAWTDYLKQINIKAGQVWNDYWFNKAEKAGLSTSEYRIGMPMTNSAQLVVEASLLNVENNVPFVNYSYDYSLDDELVTEHNKLMGFTAMSMNYNGTPRGAYLAHVKSDAKDYAFNRRSEIFFNAANCFHNQLIRGGKYIEKSVDDLCRHQVKHQGKKRKVESNEEFKRLRNRGISPDHMSAVLGNIETACVKTGVGHKSISSKVMGLIKSGSSQRKVRKGRRY